MFRPLLFPTRRAVRFPRIRGDVPGIYEKPPPKSWFSPHTRGCSSLSWLAYFSQHVFPAYAGMFRCSTPRDNRSMRFPRIRGDVPFVTAVKNAITRFSPHTRGCSVCHCRQKRHNQVFPAYAGMFRREKEIRKKAGGFPRIRGDVPADWPSGWDWSGFSPHTRGCSVVHLLVRFKPCVFPAYAGMFRPSRQGTRGFCGFPRIRGDVPMFLHLPIKTP